MRKLDCVTVFANSLEDAEKVNLAARGVMKSAAGQGSTKSHCQNFRKKSVLQKTV